MVRETADYIGDFVRTAEGVERQARRVVGNNRSMADDIFVNLEAGSGREGGREGEDRIQRTMLFPRRGPRCRCRCRCKRKRRRKLLSTVLGLIYAT